jgi:hypothetical protein
MESYPKRLLRMFYEDKAITIVRQQISPEINSEITAGFNGTMSTTWLFYPTVVRGLEILFFARHAQRHII